MAPQVDPPTYSIESVQPAASGLVAVVVGRPDGTRARVMLPSRLANVQVIEWAAVALDAVNAPKRALS
jgi:hypothetical protein